MKRKLFLLFVMLASTVGMKAKEAYVVLSQDSTTLTFYCNNNRELINEEITWNIEDGDEWYPAWHSVGGYVEKVVFDSSFVNARPNKLKFWFDEFRKLTTIEGIHNLNTSNVTDMRGIFSNCRNLASLDISNFDTSNVIYMGSMFFYCFNLASLDISNFDTSNVTNMGSMFQGCKSLTSLDLSHFDTSNVIDMSSMFEGCSSLTSLDISNFNTSKVTSMGYMFERCNLESLDLSHFDTSNVTYMKSMFYGCNISNLDLSHFDTSHVTDMGQMFAGSNIPNLDLSHFDTSNVTNMKYMFYNCKMESLDLSSFNTSNVTDMSDMFSSCRNLASLDLSSFDTSNVTNMEGMFNACGVEALDLSNFSTGKVTSMYQMFRSCYRLTSLKLTNFDTSNVTDMSWMFYSSGKLQSLDISSFCTEKVTTMWNMFAWCESLESLDLRNFDISNVESTYLMLNSCKSLRSLFISSSFSSIVNGDFSGVGYSEPCVIYAPKGFDFETDTSGDWFYWKSGRFTLGESLSEPINVVTDLGYITYCSDKTLDFTNVEGMKAYIVVGYDGKVAKLSRIGIAPAETGLLLKAGAGEYEVPYTEEDNYVMNMLIGVLEETTLAPTEGNMTNLVLANGNNGLGFYCLKGSGTLAAHRAYLQVPTRLIANGAKYIKMEFDDETTAIDGVTTQEETSTYYDMQGVRHEGKPSKQGIYIMNGKKIVVK